jgi:hypothetical protein
VEVAIKCFRFFAVPEDDAKSLKVRIPYRSRSFLLVFTHVQRATREIYAWSKAKHENVQELLGVVMFQDRLGMVSRWMERGHLREYVKRCGVSDRYGLVCVSRCVFGGRGGDLLGSVVK